MGEHRPPESYKRNQIIALDTPFGTSSMQEAPPTFSELPREIHETILIRAAVDLLLPGVYFEDVCATMSSVCKDWDNLFRDKVFRERVLQRASLTYPMCRYMKMAQHVCVKGLEDHHQTYCCVTSVGDKLYVSEEDILVAAPLRVFSYEIDDTDVRHDDPGQRKIIFSNRRSVDIIGQIRDITVLIPCPRTKCLYAVENGTSVHDPVIIHKINSSGVPVLHWSPKLNEHDDEVHAFSVTAAGAYLVVSTKRLKYIYLYSTSTGALVNKVREGDQYPSVRISTDTTLGAINTVRVGDAEGNQVYVNMLLNHQSLFLDEKGMDFQFLNGVLKMSNILDGHGCRLGINTDQIVLCDVRTNSRRPLVRENERKHLSSNCFYDKSRGLVFCADLGALRVLRITH